MQPQIGAPAITPARGDRLLNWLTGLFPVIVVAGVIVQYGFIWNSDQGPTSTNAILAWIIPVVLAVVVLAEGRGWLQQAWKHRAVLLYGLPIALAFTGATYFSAHYALDYRFSSSERSRLVDEIETKVQSKVNNELSTRNGVLPMTEGKYIDLQAMGYSNCTEVVPAAQQQPCAYKFTLETVGNEKRAQMVDKVQWTNPLDVGRSWPDLLFWLAVFFGSFVAFEQYVSAMPGPRPN